MNATGSRTREVMDFRSKHMVAWPSGLRRWFKAPVSSGAWVRIPPLPITFYIQHLSIFCVLSFSFSNLLILNTNFVFTAAFKIGASCADIQKTQGATKSGIYLIQPPNLLQGPWKVYCDLETDGGYWTVCTQFIRNYSHLSMTFE